METVAVSQAEKITPGGQKYLYDSGGCRDWQVFLWGQLFKSNSNNFCHHSWVVCLVSWQDVQYLFTSFYSRFSFGIL